MFGVEQKVDMIAASFARKKEDIHEIRELIGEAGKDIMIISKIESEEGLDNFDEILEASDGKIHFHPHPHPHLHSHPHRLLLITSGIMVARGDLGVEIPIQKVCLAQKMMIRKCNIAGKPVVTATQMLESMIKNPRPTRAEATDVANAVFDGKSITFAITITITITFATTITIPITFTVTIPISISITISMTITLGTDCVMLSGETAKGKFPAQAVATMARICSTAELAIDYNSQFLSILAMTDRPFSRPEAVASSAVKTEVHCHHQHHLHHHHHHHRHRHLQVDLDAALIIVLTESGASARIVAKYKPSVPIVTLTHEPRVHRQLMTSRAVWPMVVERKPDTELVSDAIQHAKAQRYYYPISITIPIPIPIPICVSQVGFNG